ncbi:hypothetical protein [Candidatus Mesenet endosymbiont of Agriotes lineatus]
MPAVKEKSNVNIGCTKDLRLRMAEKTRSTKLNLRKTLSEMAKF